jgi:hypothetical protein
VQQLYQQAVDLQSELCHRRRRLRFPMLAWLARPAVVSMGRSGWPSSSFAGLFLFLDNRCCCLCLHLVARAQKYLVTQIKQGRKWGVRKPNGCVIQARLGSKDSSVVERFVAWCVLTW